MHNTNKNNNANSVSKTECHRRPTCGPRRDDDTTLMHHEFTHHLHFGIFLVARARARSRVINTRLTHIVRVCTSHRPCGGLWHCLCGWVDAFLCACVCRGLGRVSVCACVPGVYARALCLCMAFPMHSHVSCLGRFCASRGAMCECVGVCCACMHVCKYLR